MDIILHDIKQAQLPLIRELAKALGVSFEKAVDHNKEAIDAAIERIESGKADLKDMDWNEFRALAYGR